MWASVVLIFATFFQPNTTSALPSEQIIRNYWEHIQGLMLQFDELREKETDPSWRKSRVSSKKFPFDLLKDLHARELLRACREGIESAKKEGIAKKWSEQEISLKCEENIAYVLEYYGILIEKFSEVDYLIYCMGAEQETPELRLFLLKNCMNENNPKTLFSIHFNSLLENREEELQKILIATVKRVNENPEIQKASMDTLYNYFKSKYQKVLEKDPIYQAYALQQKQEINPLWLDNVQIPKPTETTQIEIGKLNNQINEFMTQLEIKIKDKRQIDTSISEKAKEILEKIYNSLPVSNKERLKSLIASKE
ncbi:MAG TPA: hypothetical protein PLT82_06465 [Candidatus Hydrogenedens sp.]|nr:hypothetical protein [Candidatus Hydrogenedens sp.]HOK08935.1 hypothetical protein [Candidatus Hydrogenedens sp.]HOL19736.1 hypothetical protein [Candidatus Hydrogenedens sp.]HPP58759.1 hypothetical protein [Candidatus Hydrogenedens sp.]